MSEQRVDDRLRAELLRRRWPRARRGFAYWGGGDLLLLHGRFYPGRRLPAQYEQHRGPAGVCFRNAALAALADDSLSCAEGSAHGR